MIQASPNLGNQPESSSVKVSNSTAIPVHAVSIEELVAQLELDQQQGLTKKQIDERIQKYGRNELQATKKESIWKIVFRQFNSLIVWVLAFAAGFSFFTADLLEGYAIVGVILINALMGFVLELRARQSMEALQSMVSEAKKFFAAASAAEGENSRDEAEQVAAMIGLPNLADQVQSAVDSAPRNTALSPAEVRGAVAQYEIELKEQLELLKAQMQGAQ